MFKTDLVMFLCFFVLVKSYRKKKKNKSLKLFKSLKVYYFSITLSPLNSVGCLPVI